MLLNHKPFRIKQGDFTGSYCRGFSGHLNPNYYGTHHNLHNTCSSIQRTIFNNEECHSIERISVNLLPEWTSTEQNMSYLVKSCIMLLSDCVSASFIGSGFGILCLIQRLNMLQNINHLDREHAGQCRISNQLN